MRNASQSQSSESERLVHERGDPFDLHLSHDARRSEFGRVVHRHAAGDDVRIQNESRGARKIARTRRSSPSPFSRRFRSQVPRLGLMLVGWGGNNGSTLTGSLIANRFGMRWRTKDGEVVRSFGGVAEGEG